MSGRKTIWPDHSFNPARPIQAIDYTVPAPALSQMEDFLAFLFEVVADLVIQIFGELLLELLFRAIGKFFSAIFESSRLFMAAIVLLLGALIGAGSLACMASA